MLFFVYFLFYNDNLRSVFMIVEQDFAWFLLYLIIPPTFPGIWLGNLAGHFV